MGEKIKYTSYTAGAIEKDTSQGMVSWRNELKEKLKDTPIVFYDPVEREAQKTGKPAGEHVKYVIGLKQGGHWEKFQEEMKKIWFGMIKPEGHIIDIFTYLRNRKLIDGNEERDFIFWGDWEAVLRSDFIVANIKKDVQTIGTVGEIVLTYMFNIPIYLIIDVPKTECNSTLLHWVLSSGGDVFYSVNDCIKFLKDKYK